MAEEKHILVSLIFQIICKLNKYHIPGKITFYIKYSQTASRIMEHMSMSTLAVSEPVEPGKYEFSKVVFQMYKHDI